MTLSPATSRLHLAFFGYLVRHHFIGSVALTIRLPAANDTVKLLTLLSHCSCGHKTVLAADSNRFRHGQQSSPEVGTPRMFVAPTPTPRLKTLHPLLLPRPAPHYQVPLLALEFLRACCLHPIDDLRDWSSKTPSRSTPVAIRQALRFGAKRLRPVANPERSLRAHIR